MQPHNKTCRVNLGLLWLGAAMLGGLAMLPTMAWGEADQCYVGAKIRVSGVAGDIYANKAGGWSMVVRNIRSPCKLGVPLLPFDKPLPSACRTGAQVSATVVLYDVWLDDLVAREASDPVCR